MDKTVSGYVYIATDEGASRSYVGVAPSLLDMEWIAKYGVDHLVWFEGYSDITLAQDRAEQLIAMSEEERRTFFQRRNPAQSDLSLRVWGSDQSG